jgi:hypothetical protein
MDLLATTSKPHLSSLGNEAAASVYPSILYFSKVLQNEGKIQPKVPLGVE